MLIKVWWIYIDTYIHGNKLTLFFLLMQTMKGRNHYASAVALIRGGCRRPGSALGAHIKAAWSFRKGIQSKSDVANATFTPNLTVPHVRPVIFCTRKFHFNFLNLSHPEEICSKGLYYWELTLHVTHAKITFMLSCITYIFVLIILGKRIRWWTNVTIDAILLVIGVIFWIAVGAVISNPPNGSKLQSCCRTSIPFHLSHCMNKTVYSQPETMIS